MRLREVLRNISNISETHLKLGSHYLIIENHGRQLRCVLYHWIEYRYGGEPVKVAYKSVEELPGFLNELKEELGATRTTVVRIWT